MPTKRQFDMVIGILIGVHLFIPLAKAVLARHAASDDGLVGEAARTAELAI